MQPLKGECESCYARELDIAAQAAPLRIVKLQRTTWILVTVALVLSTAVYLGEIRGREWREAARVRRQQLFDFPAEAVEAIAIQRRDQETLTFQRSPTELRTWDMAKPVVGTANDPALSFLLNQLVSGQQQQAFTIQRRDRPEYGLLPPAATVTITVADRPQPHTLILGRPNFEEQLVYALVDPPQEADAELEVVLVPIDLQYAVERELNEWLQAPMEDEETEGAGDRR